MIWLWTWGIVTAIALVVEFLTADLITIWFAAGGLTTLLVVALAPNLPLIWQLIIFVGVSIVLLLLSRKICLKLLSGDDAKTNSDALIGMKFTVDKIDNSHTYHKFNGIDWCVYAIDGETLEVGAEFEICKISGNKLLAKKVVKK